MKKFNLIHSSRLVSSRLVSSLKRGIPILFIFFTVFLGNSTVSSSQNPCVGAQIRNVGSNYGIYNLSQAIAAGLMVPEPTTNKYDPSQWPIQYLFVSGTFTFNDPGSYDNYYLYQSTIYMDAGAEIRIAPSNMVVNLYQSEVVGCEALWHRILVRGGGSLVAYQSTIRDAYHAVELSDGSYSIFNQCNFEDNYIGIRSESNPLQGGGDPASPYFFEFDAFRVVGCNFNYINGLLPAYSGISLIIDKPYAGIWLEETKFALIGGLPIPGFVNNFDQLVHGIYLEKSNAKISMCKFQNIHHQGQMSLLLNTSAISAIGINQLSTHLDFEGLGMNGFESTFSNCRHAFIITRTNAIIRESKGELVNTALFHTINAPRMLTFENNKFTCNSGILSFSPIFTILSNYQSWLVKSSQFNLIGSSTMSDLGPEYGNKAGIFLRQAHYFNTNSSLGIRDNIFNVLEPTSAIKSTGISGLRVQDNVINVDIPSTSTQTLNIIELFLTINFSDPNQFLRNKIIDVKQPGGSLHRGFRVALSRHNNYYCNEVRGVEEAFSFVGNCNYSNFELNDLLSNDIGLDLRPAGSTSAIIGPQYDEANNKGKMNRWGLASSYTTAGARHHSNLPEIAEMSQFRVHNKLLPYWPNPLIDPSPPKVWFIQRGQPGDECQENLEELEEWESLRQLTWGDSLVIQDSIGSLSSEDQWMLRYNLYQKLYNDSLLRVEDMATESWYNGQTQLADLVELEKVIWQDMTGMTESDGEVLKARTDSLILILERIAQIDTLINGGTNVLLEFERDSLFAIMDDLGLIDSLEWVQVDSNRQVALSQAIILHNAFTPVHAYEQYLHDVYEVILETQENNWIEPDSAGKVTIHDIAGLCLGVGGQATAIARSIEASYVHNNYDDDILCSAQSAPFQPIQVPKSFESNATFELMPNPTTDMIIIKGKAGAGEWILMDVLGRKVFSQNIDLSGGQTSVSGLSQLNAGTYLWQFHSNDQTTNANGILVRE